MSFLYYEEAVNHDNFASVINTQFHPYKIVFQRIKNAILKSGETSSSVGYPKKFISCFNLQAGYLYSRRNIAATCLLSLFTIFISFF